MKIILLLFLMLILSKVAFAQCVEGEVELWDVCYNIQETTHLELHNVSGAIPPEIGSLINLTYLNIEGNSNNQLIGEIPHEIGNLINLTGLSLELNQLNGELPDEIGNLVNLEQLWLFDNQLSGEIPPEIGNMVSISTFKLENNQLSGEIPHEICELMLLIPNYDNWLFQIHNNNLCPPYPSCIEEFVGFQECNTEIYGCTDIFALNFDPEATIGDESCEYPSLGDISMDGIINVNDIVLLVGIVLDGEVYIEYMDINQDFYLNIIDIITLVDIILNPALIGCTDPNALNFNPVALYDDGNCDYSNIVIDIDGNIYTTVIIGSQEWMAENLRVTQYRNGNSIPNVLELSEWSLLNSGGYCYLNNDEQNIDVFGNFYNWGAVIDESEICPEDWHIPTDDEWQILVDFLGGDDIAGGSLKSTGTVESGDGLWFEPNVGATNNSGFTSLPAGYRYFDGLYYMQGEGSYFWSSTERFNRGMVWGRALVNTYTWVSHYSFGYPGTGASIRCVRD